MKARLLLRILSVFVMLATCGYLAYSAWHHPQIWDQFWSLRTLAYGAAGLASVAAGDFCVCYAWILMARDRESPTKSSALYAAFMTSQLGKYLPGNIFHLAGRYTLARKAGASHAALTTSLALEPLGVVATAATLTALPFAAWLASLATSSHFDATKILWSIGLLAALAVTVCFATVIYLGKDTFVSKVRAIANDARARILPHIVSIFLFYAGYLFFQVCTMVICLVYSGWAFSPSDAPALWSAGIISWLAGYVISGAPGGLGVREFTMIQMIPFIPHAILLQAALLWRALCIIYDVLAFFAGSWLFSRTTVKN